MRPDARVTAAIEIVGLVLNGSAADRALVTWGKANRFAGSGDRRAIGDIVFAALRSGDTSRDPRRMVIAGLSASHHPDALDALFTGARHGSPPLSEAERADLGLPSGTLPAWLATSLARAWGDAAPAELVALQGRAPLDLRVNSIKATRDVAIEKLAEDGILAAPLPLIGTALRVATAHADIEHSEAHKLGLVEIQDAGSQVAAAALDAKPGESVLDLCAGAGGKTLAIAAAMENTGAILACDTGAVRLKRLPGRAARAGITMIETRLLAENWLNDPSPFTQTFDRVLIDAPCSGSGTWRRNPETRARLTPEAIAALIALQIHLLAAAAPLVKPGGRLTYITCSVLPDEDEDVVEAFLSAHPNFTPAGPQQRLSPHTTGTDGFFIASLTRGL